MKLFPHKSTSREHARPEKLPGCNPAHGFLRRELLGPNAIAEGPTPAFEVPTISRLFQHRVKRALMNLYLSSLRVEARVFRRVDSVVFPNLLVTSKGDHSNWGVFRRSPIGPMDSDVNALAHSVGTPDSICLDLRFGCRRHEPFLRP